MHKLTPHVHPLLYSPSLSLILHHCPTSLIAKKRNKTPPLPPSDAVHYSVQYLISACRNSLLLCLYVLLFSLSERPARRVPKAHRHNDNLAEAAFRECYSVRFLWSGVKSRYGLLGVSHVEDIPMTSFPRASPPYSRLQPYQLSITDQQKQKVNIDVYQSTQ
jgi:hypothetical protein